MKKYINTWSKDTGYKGEKQKAIINYSGKTISLKKFNNSKNFFSKFDHLLWPPYTFSVNSR